MIKSRLLLLAALLATAASTHVHAFDGQRKGFQIGVGIGAHTSEIGYRAEFAPQTVDSAQQMAISGQLGYGFSNRIVGFLGGRGGSVVIDNREASLAVVGFGATVYFNESSPSIYATGMFGSASIGFADEEPEFNDVGKSWMIGVGYEVTDRLHLELSHAQAVLQDPNNAANESTLQSSFITASYVWY